MNLDLTFEMVEKAMAQPGRGPLILAVLRAVDQGGGSLDSADAKSKVLDVFGDLLTPGQKEFLRTQRIGWIRTSLRGWGLLRRDTPGMWVLTELGKEFVERHRDDVLKAPTNLPDGVPSQREYRRETVRATELCAYEIPLLRILADAGAQMRKIRLSEAVLERYGSQLLPGDRRRLPSGEEVVVSRVAEALMELKKKGEVIHLGRGRWAITPPGRTRLEADESGWKLGSFQDASQLSVLAESAAEAESVVKAPAVDDTWVELAGGWGFERIRAIRDRLQTDAGATPVEGRPNRNLILYGPPGTGKTYLAKQLARVLTGLAQPGTDSNWRIVQFHPSYAYEDFVQGIRPVLGGGELGYKLQDGPFREICSNALEDPDNFYVLVIDEINRGDPARIFGEALYGLEYRGESVELAVGGSLTVPHNLVVIGTMNSVDRSVALVDYALRRRFGFVRLSPDPEIVAGMGRPGAEAAAQVLRLFNQWIAQELDEDHTLGHSFFFGHSALDRAVLERIWREDWLPLLEEYFFGDQAKLREATRAWESYLDKSLRDVEPE